MNVCSYQTRGSHGSHGSHVHQKTESDLYLQFMAESLHLSFERGSALHILVAMVNPGIGLVWFFFLKSVFFNMKGICGRFIPPLAL